MLKKNIIWAGFTLGSRERQVSWKCYLEYLSKRVHHKLTKVNFAIGFCITELDVQGEIYLYMVAINIEVEAKKLN
jgi:hypothetical protein